MNQTDNHHVLLGPPRWGFAYFGWPTPRPVAWADIGLSRCDGRVIASIVAQKSHSCSNGSIVAQCFLIERMELTRRMFWHVVFNRKSQRDGRMSAQAIGLGLGIATKQNPNGVALIREQT